MTLHSESLIVESLKMHLSQHDNDVVKDILKLVTVTADELIQEPDRLRVLNLMNYVVAEVYDSLVVKGRSKKAFATKKFHVLPVFKLKVADIIEQGWVEVSQASFYRAVDCKRFYSVTPAGRTIGKEFPAWQFVSPVPEIISPVLKKFENVTDSEIHAFWVSEADELNSMSPAEVLAGIPFSTRERIFDSQSGILTADVRKRAAMVDEFAELKLRDVAELIG